ncbi:hypothetical protein QBC41DRAFT_244686 [Cercophora samala]|uniref:Uncharacterized protein n=1 Tax=Cercophora samala TaxID=330535 RepID=A0AA39ZJA6_9PEZI|nr:hypothetical protein QBC41DRAFT_244686 [Cercophora samala]
MNGYHHNHDHAANRYHHRPTGGFASRGVPPPPGFSPVLTTGLPPLQPAPRPPPPPPSAHAIPSTPPGTTTSLTSAGHQQSIYHHHHHHQPHRPHVPATISPPPQFSSPPSSAAETRTLLTFPTPGLPSPRIVRLSQPPVRYPPSTIKYTNSDPHHHRHIISTLQTTSNLRNLSFLFHPTPARPLPLPLPLPQQHPLDSTSHLPTQIQTNRWLCCQCAEEGFIDPVGTVHLDLPHPRSGIQQHQQQQQEQGETETESAAREEGEMHNQCLFRPSSCHHKKCVNCVLYAGPASSRDPIRGAKFLVRTVGGLYTSGRFIDPVRWECDVCGEWEGNKIDGGVRMGVGCQGRGCSSIIRGGHHGWGRRGVLSGERVVLNRYGQRLGTADQRVAFEGGPWDWHRRGLGDRRCVLSKGVREVLMRRGGEGGRGRERRVWGVGEEVPGYEYRRPPPLDEDDERENSEYEGGFLAGLPVESGDKGKGKEREVGMGMEGVVHNGQGEGKHGDDGRHHGGNDRQEHGGFTSPSAAATTTTTRSSDTGQGPGARPRFFPGLSHMRM